MKIKSIVFLLVGIVPLSSSLRSEAVESFPLDPISHHEPKQETTDDSYKVLSYKDVLKSYYDLVTKEVNTPSKTFDDFVDSYYEENSDRDLYHFTLNLAKENNRYDEVYNTLSSENNYFSSSSGSLSMEKGGGRNGRDATYVLKNDPGTGYASRQCFARELFYFAYDYSALKTGDIVYERETAFFNIGHNALITGTNLSSEYGEYVQTIEAVAGGVQRGFLDDLRMIDFKCEILRVVGRNDSNARGAIDFAKKQLGKLYQFSLPPKSLNTDINSVTWYCSELVYASWKYVGIDISARKGLFGNDKSPFSFCLPVDIYKSNNTYSIYVPNKWLLKFEIVSKSWQRWKIRIRNCSHKGLEIKYNTKMCFYEDAKDWRNLYDLIRKKIAAHSFIEVEISENWFANSIVASYLIGDKRFISIADYLNGNGNFSFHQNILAGAAYL